jgi:hypothetical protein
MAGDDQQRGPSDVVRVHQAALELLGRRSLRPDRFAGDAEALEAALALERRALEFARQASFVTSFRMELRGPHATGVLRDDGASARRIDAWLRA